jgi:hypothetical protein
VARRDGVAAAGNGRGVHDRPEAFA